MSARLTAPQALAALCAARLTYRCDAEADRWTATCIGCRRPAALIITEPRADGPVTVGCTHRCHEPAQLAELLARDPNLIEADAARAEAARWRAFAWRTVDRFRRYIELTGERAA
jgi:hypothetical protein